MKHSIVKSSAMLALILSSAVLGAAQAADTGFRPWDQQRFVADAGEPSTDVSKVLIGFHPWDMQGTKNAASAKSYELAAATATIGLVGFHPWYLN